MLMEKCASSRSAVSQFNVVLALKWDIFRTRTQERGDCNWDWSTVLDSVDWCIVFFVNTDTLQILRRKVKPKQSWKTKGSIPENRSVPVHRACHSESHI